MSHRIVVLGIGNSLLQDEGVGIHALHYFQSLNPPFDGIEWVDGGTLGFILAEVIASAEQLLVFDAAQLGAAAGAVALFENEAMDQFLGRAKPASVHEVGLRDLIFSSHLLGDTPQKRALIGIQPACMEWGEQPTAAVAAALPKAAELAQQQLLKWCQTP